MVLHAEVGPEDQMVAGSPLRQTDGLKRPYVRGLTPRIDESRVGVGLAAVASVVLAIDGLEIVFIVHLEAFATGPTMVCRVKTKALTVLRVPMRSGLRLCRGTSQNALGSVVLCRM